MIMDEISIFITKQRAKQLCTECSVIAGFYVRFISASFALKLKLLPISCMLSQRLELSYVFSFKQKA